MARAVLVTEGAAPQSGLATPPALEAVALAFPELEVMELIGRGGMGVVYKARQKSLNRLVALKLLAPERVTDAQFAERFAKEARALAALNHPNIVTVHDFGETGGFYFLLMEFVAGVNLRQAMQAGRFTPAQALAIVPPVCEALQYAHDHGIVHRDIKPENLLLDREGRVKIADFGIAKMLGSEASENISQPVGTPRYMAPEQGVGATQIDHRADIYSLGVVLYELLTGELPSARLEAPSRKVQIDVRLDEVVLRALNQQPELRWQSAVEMQTQVETVVGAASEEEAAARHWLAVMDAGEYEDSWSRAHSSFRRAATKADWMAKSKQVRRPLGGVVSRSAQRGKLPSKGGDVAILMFNSAFDGLREAVETVTVRRGESGQWQVTGYLIRPAGYIAPVSASRNQQLMELLGFHTLWGQRLFVLSQIGWLAFLGFIPGFEKLCVLSLFTALLAVAGVVEWAHKRKQPPVFERRPRWQRALGKVIIALMIAIPLRTWVIQAFVINGKSLEPEMPPGSHLLVWKLSNNYVPGDIVAYRHGSQTWVGRVVKLEGENLVVQRNQSPEEMLPLADVIGKVVSVYWRPNPEPLVLKTFSSTDAVISKELKTAPDGSWIVDCKGPQVVRLFEFPMSDIDNCALFYRAQLKSEDLEGRAFLEMWCRMPGGGEYFSRGLGNVSSVTKEWSTFVTPFFLQKGEKPELIKLNLAIEGKGKVSIKDIEVTAQGPNLHRP